MVKSKKKKRRYDAYNPVKRQGALKKHRGGGKGLCLTFETPHLQMMANLQSPPSIYLVSQCQT